MELERETGWQLHPISGDTGQAYMGIRNEEKLFLKRNSSPFLAALSVEGITPRLIWTTRIGNGDVLTAQEWCNGRTLEKEEMNTPQVPQMLGRIHESEALKRMLKRVGGIVFFPEDFVTQYENTLSFDLSQHKLMNQVLDLLKLNMPKTSEEDLRVCHGDLYRKNWLLSDANHLYVVDWDSTMLADSAYDLAMVLSKYINEDEWATWLSHYNKELTPELEQKIKWYSLMIDLFYVNELHNKGYFHQMNDMLLKLEQRVKNWFY